MLKNHSMRKTIQQLTERILSEGRISFEDAYRLLSVENNDLFFLLDAANRIRIRFRANKISLCAITNAKSGDCSEDCAFCSQSWHYNTNIKTYPLILKREILKRARLASDSGAHRFCIVISGKGIETNEELNQICDTIKQIKKEFPHLKMDASLGYLDFSTAKRLKDAGLDRYNHNLETTEDFFANICTTHTFQDRLKTVKILKDVGIEVCCGGIFGLGETEKQRVEFAFTLRELDVDCIPLNFLNPIKGTPLEDNQQTEPLGLLKIIAIFRFILPQKQIRICAGRQKNLRSLQSMIFIAGADAIILGDYLTTKGGLPSEDLQMLTDLGLDFTPLEKYL